jgi:dihydrofolate reductase
MATVIAGMTVSLDGFVADRDGHAGRLFPDFDALRDTPYMGEMIERTGAVLMGRRTFEMGDPDAFVTDGVESAVTRASAAAGDKVVQVVGGADLIRQLLRAGLVDELHLDVMPVLLGTGISLFGDPALAGLRLEKLAVEEAGPRTTLRFRVVG